MRLTARSAWRKALAMAGAIVIFLLFYQASTFDSRDAVRALFDPTRPVPGTQRDFAATAYCKGTTTASGVAVRTGVAAADPDLLPVGSVVNVVTDEARYNGIYTVMDTGPKVQGRELDLYMWSCNEALTFGRKDIQVTVLRLGWNPSASTPSMIDRLFRRREAAQRTVTPVVIPPAAVPLAAIPPPAAPAAPTAVVPEPAALESEPAQDEEGTSPSPPVTRPDVSNEGPAGRRGGSG